MDYYYYYNYYNNNNNKSLYFESVTGSLVFFYGPEVTPTRVTTSGVLVEASEDDGEEVWLTT